MPDKAWKVFERKVAKDFGCTRNALSGRNSKVTASDTLHTDLFIEAKTRKSFSLHKLFKSVRELAQKEDKVPVVVTKERGKHGYLITLRPEDLQKVASFYKKD